MEIDRIFEMIADGEDETTRQKGIGEGRKVRFLSVFCQPREGKRYWEGCAEILAGKTAHARSTKLTGTMANKGSVTGTISSKSGTYTIPQGYHDGGGKVGISTAEQAKIIAGNIKSGVEILGVTGSYSGEEITAQSKNVTPSFTSQTVQPDTGYDYLAAVTVAAIPVVYADNAAGGQTVTIG